MTKKIFIAGSTGSIGTQALKVCEMHNIKVEALSANKSWEALCKQAKKYNVKKVHINDEQKYYNVKNELSDDVEVYAGRNGLFEMIASSSADTFLNGITGFQGLEPTVCAIEKKMKIALANKETIVCGGEFIMNKVEKENICLMPVDSEHSAVFQCLLGNRDKDVKRIILTASGGPFFGRKSLKGITKEEALNHPNWSMGNKITIDSATLMNKALEVIEAYHLFGKKKIDVVVHRESIVHSMVEFCDNSVMAQMGTPDMAIPIQLALTYPKRRESVAGELDFSKILNLSFYPPDTDTFISLRLSYDALKIGGTMPCVLNAANEVAVEAFLGGKIEFEEIAVLTEETMAKIKPIYNYSLNDILECDFEAREYAKANLKN